MRLLPNKERKIGEPSKRRRKGKRQNRVFVVRVLSSRALAVVATGNTQTKHRVSRLSLQSKRSARAKTCENISSTNDGNTFCYSRKRLNNCRRCNNSAIRTWINVAQCSTLLLRLHTNSAATQWRLSDAHTNTHTRDDADVIDVTGERAHSVDLLSLLKRQRLLLLLLLLLSR